MNGVCHLHECGETVTRKDTVPILDVRLVVSFLCCHCRRHCSLQSFNGLKIKNSLVLLVPVELLELELDDVVGGPPVAERIKHRV